MGAFQTRAAIGTSKAVPGFSGGQGAALKPAYTRGNLHRDSHIGAEPPVQADGPAERAQLPICVISSNRLAGKYLAGLLTRDSLYFPMSADELIARAAEFPTPLFVVDCNFLTLPLSECINRLKAKLRSPYFIVVDKDLAATEILFLLSLGIHGFVAEHQIDEALSQAANTVVSGGFWIPEKALRAYVRSAALNGSPRSRYPGAAATTQRESQVLELLRRRLSNKEIADLLNIRESTVKYHVSNLFGKLQVTSRHELAHANAMPETLAQIF